MKEKTKGFLTEFKEFAMKGNVIDLAVGVVMGTAFNKIVSSLVSDIIMPLFAAILGETDFKSLEIILREATDPKNNITLKYGLFIQNIVDFLIIALSIFVMIKVISKLNRTKEEAVEEKVVEEKVEEVVEPSKEEILLTEIRDLLKNK